MRTLKTLAILGAATVALSACGDGNIGPDKTQDRGPLGVNSLATMVPGIWTDPQGCEHWIIDDGVEGYLSARLTPDGKPVCTGTAPPEYVVGPFKQTADVNDKF